ncbi:MAG: cob(I)yrinic acid a,c-diamide adenosyltransferase [Candidatus Omnitrophota bacterium]
MIQVYTGNGKGKTTAALGLALRAAGAGLKVYIAQFAKGRHYSELNSLKKLKNIKLEQFGRGCFIGKIPAKTDITLAGKGLKKIKKIISRKAYRVVILDEINIALKLKLVELEDVIGLLKRAPKKTEIILTGRYAPAAIIKIADLVSQIRQVKHYYKRGLPARKGIEH